MSQTAEETSKQPATVRAEALLDNAGQRIGLIAAQTVQRIQHAATQMREEADRLDQPEASSQEKPGPTNGARTDEGGKPTTERAEVLVDQLGQRISHYAALTSLQIMRATARVREEAEDMWAEAQNIRQESGRKQ
jgi:tRNA U34 5-carboxymethylaminomethyl modifying enzyme MnmG/GidA